jgi:hypothetical protein
MHRTLSTDYCFVLEGELDLLLDGGEVVRLQPGDTLVQRGTKHAWSNPSQSERFKFIVCMVEASPVTIAGKILQPTPMWQMIASSLRSMIFPRKTPPDLRRPDTNARADIRRVVTGHDHRGRSIVKSVDDTA